VIPTAEQGNYRSRFWAARACDPGAGDGQAAEKRDRHHISYFDSIVHGLGSCFEREFGQDFVRRRFPEKRDRHHIS